MTVNFTNGCLFYWRVNEDDSLFDAITNEIINRAAELSCSLSIYFVSPFLFMMFSLFFVAIFVMSFTGFFVLMISCVCDVFTCITQRMFPHTKAGSEDYIEV